MGYPMAGHLRRKMSPKDTLYVTDVNKSALDRFLDEMGTKYGPVEVVDSCKKAADNAKVVISIVPRAVNVKEVYLGAGGVIEANPDPERLLLECSTIDTRTTREVEAKLSPVGIGRYFDAPVSVSSSIRTYTHRSPSESSPFAELSNRAGL